MTLGQLKLFKDIAQTRSMSRGAAMNEVSQSAASQHVQEIERQLETGLLDRSRRPLVLTPAGELYLAFCRDAVARKDEFDADLARLKGKVEGAVRVASIYSVGLSEMSQLEGAFTLRYPDADLRVDYLRPEKVYLAVLEDRADLGLISYPEPGKEIKVIPWRRERMVVAVAPEHELARRPALTPEELNGQDFVGFDEDLPISRDVGRYLRDHNVEVNRVMHFDNIQTMKEAVVLGSGFSIMPERILAADVEQGRLTAIPLGAPELFRPLGIIHRKKKRFNRAAQMFLQLLREEPAPG